MVTTTHSHVVTYGFQEKWLWDVALGACGLGRLWEHMAMGARGFGDR